MSLSLKLSLAILYLISCQVQSNVILQKFNKNFLESYQQARNVMLSTIDPLIVTNNENLTLKYRGQEQSFRVNHQLYHNLKAVSHIPFTIYLYTFNIESCDRNLSLDELTKLQLYLQQIHEMRSSINISDFASDRGLFQSVRSIIDLSVKFLGLLIRSKQLNVATLNNFCHNATKLFSRTVTRAAHAQLDQVHSVIYPIYTQLFNETERATVKVVILGGKSPRKGAIFMQYFEKLLGGQSLEDKRIIYAEGIRDYSIARNLMGSWLLDAYSANAFFDDPTRLHQDLFIDDTKAYIKTLFETSS